MVGLEVWLDDQPLLDTNNTTDQQLEFLIVDDETDHELRFVMKNKTNDHTRLDTHGNIIKDAMISVENFKIDDIDISSILTCYPNQLYSDVPTHIIQYRHDFNGTQPAVVDRFYGSMGCNGTVILKFTTPIYLWLLENM